MAQNTSDNRFDTADWIVSVNAWEGTHTTIQGAINDASLGDLIYIKPGTYTEDIALIDGLIIASFASGQGGQARIIGKISQTTGTSVISGIRINTNADYCYEVTGSGVVQTTFFDCMFFATDNNIIIINNSNASPSFENCNVFSLTTQAVFDITSCNTVTFDNCLMSSGGNSTVSNVAAGNVRIRNLKSLHYPYSTSLTGKLEIDNVSMDSSNFGKIAVTTSGTGTSSISNSVIKSGTASCVSVGSGTTVAIDGLTAKSSNTNPITGAGTITYAPVLFGSTGKVINTTTKTAYNLAAGGITFDHGTNYLSTYLARTSYSPVITGSTTNPDTVTYNTNQGYYVRVGNVVHFTVHIDIATWTLGSGAGNLVISSPPITSANLTLQGLNLTVTYDNLTLPASTIDIVGRVEGNTQKIDLFSSKDNAAKTFVLLSGVSATTNLFMGGWYYV